ncbi:MAG: DNA-3-methyladenine glycosylase family protein [bacterium]
MNPDWTPWRPLAPALRLTPGGLAELVNGGQAFRWWRQPDGSYIGQWSHFVAALRPAAPASSTDPEDSGTLEWSAPRDLTAELETGLPSYLGITADQDRALDQLPWRSDAHLRRCLAAFPGLRILRQPFGETLVGFLCSATKQIVQIKQMLALLAERHGSPLPQVCHWLDNKPLRALPTWTQLAALSEDQLRECQLGFRARYIKGTADFLAHHPGWLEQTAGLPYAEARTALCTLPGVGEKIADCVALFGLGHLEAFPVDTWMIKAMSRRYGLTGWSPTQVAHFGRVHFGQGAGLAQQYLFAWERAYGNKA